MLDDMVREQQQERFGRQAAQSLAARTVAKDLLVPLLEEYQSLVD